MWRGIYAILIEAKSNNIYTESLGYDISKEGAGIIRVDLSLP